MTAHVETTPRLVSVTRAAADIGITPRAVHDLVAAGILQTRRVPGRKRAMVVTDSINRWLDDGAAPAPERRVSPPAPMVIPPFQGSRRAS